MRQVPGVWAAQLRLSIPVIAALVVLSACSSGSASSSSSNSASTDSPVAGTGTTSVAVPGTDVAPTGSVVVSMSPDAADAPAYAPALEASVRAIVEKSTVPSAIVIVRSGRYGDVTFTSGATGLGGSVPVSTTDHARFGSITKSMTATIILQLVQEGLLTLDDPVSKFVPGVPDGDNITVAQLLEMRSGLYSYTNDPTFVRESDADLTRPWTPDELLDLAFAHPAEFPPGSNFQYSNTNYILLGKIMEILTGQTVQELFQHRLFTPSACAKQPCPGPKTPPRQHLSCTGITTAASTSRCLTSEQARAAAGSLLPVDQSILNPSWAWTAGSVISTADDMLIWARALVDGALLDPAMQQVRLDSIQSLGPDFPAAEGKYWYGFGIDRRVTYDGHGGQINGYNTAVARDPATDTDVVVLTTLTLAPDGTSVANALLYGVINGITDTDTDVEVPQQTGEEGP